MYASTLEVADVPELATLVPAVKSAFAEPVSETAFSYAVLAKECVPYIFCPNISIA